MQNHQLAKTNNRMLKFHIDLLTPRRTIVIGTLIREEGLESLLGWLSKEDGLLYFFNPYGRLPVIISEGVLEQSSLLTLQAIVGEAFA